LFADAELTANDLGLRQNADAMALKMPYLPISFPRASQLSEADSGDRPAETTSWVSTDYPKDKSA
jgi:hypothetical protein